MFSLVAVMCLYLGVNNIRKAFASPIGSWQAINRMLAISGALLLFVGLACAWQAIKDHKENSEKKREKRREEDKKKKRQFFFDEEEATEESEETNEAFEDGEIISESLETAQDDMKKAQNVGNAGEDTE